jgi:hypothetical protein
LNFFFFFFFFFQIVFQRLSFSGRLSSDSWIGVDGVRVLKPTSQVWTSPVSKTVFKKAPLANRANTVQIFSTKDMEEARKMMAAKRPVPAPKPGEVLLLKKEISSLKEENDRLMDGIMTQTRANYRLREDLRVMVERAQGYKDSGEEALAELKVSERQVKNLEQMMENDAKIAHAREKAMRSQLLTVLAVQNETVAALKQAKSDLHKANLVNEGLRTHIVKLEQEQENEKQEKEKMREKGEKLASSLEALMQESERAIQNMSKSMILQTAGIQF